MRCTAFVWFCEFPSGANTFAQTLKIRPQNKLIQQYIQLKRRHFLLLESATAQFAATCVSFFIFLLVDDLSYFSSLSLAEASSSSLSQIRMELRRKRWNSVDETASFAAGNDFRFLRRAEMETHPKWIFKWKKSAQPK